MTLAATKTFVDATDHTMVLFGTIAASGSYSTGGDTLNLGGLIPGKTLPFNVDFQSQAGYVYTWVPGTDITNGKMQVHVNTGAGVNLPLPEHTAAAYNAGVTGDVISFQAYFAKLGGITPITLK